MSERPGDEETAGYVDAFAADVDVHVDVDAAWARFEAEVGPQPRARWVWVAAAGALVAAALLTWFSLPARTASAVDEHAGQQARDEADRAETEVAPLVQPERRVVHEPAPQRAPAPAPEPEAENIPAPTGVQNEAPPRGRKGKAPAEPPPSGLAEELRLLEALRKASAAGRHADALAKVREHARRFPGGSFAAERELARVRALCGLGRLASMRKAKAEFAATFGASHLASLVRTACEESNGSDHDG